MKHFKLILLWIAFFCSSLGVAGVHASKHAYYYDDSQGEFGLGMMFGNPTGLTAKYWMDNHVALDFALAYSWNGGFVGMTDVLYHFHVKHDHAIKPYIGIGLGGMMYHYRTYYANYYEGGLIARMPLGVEIKPSFFGLFLEVAPALMLAPCIDPMLQGDVGLRFYF